MTLQGARILVVGGGSGIGFAVAQAAMAEGAEVTIASTNRGQARRGGRAARRGETAVLDLTDEAAVAAFFAASGQFDHIASTAGDWGKARRGPFAEMDLDDAKALFGVRFWGAAMLAKHGAARVSPGRLADADQRHERVPAAEGLGHGDGNGRIGRTPGLWPGGRTGADPGQRRVPRRRRDRNIHRPARGDAQGRGSPLRRPADPAHRRAGRSGGGLSLSDEGGYTTGQILQVDGGGVLGG